MRHAATPLLLLGLLGACGIEGPRPGTAAAPADPQPTSYDARVTSSCGERRGLGTFDVEVREGEVARAVPVGRSLRTRLAWVPTLQDMVDRAEDAGGDVRLDLDEAGRPMRLVLDPDPRGVDEEECYRVADLRVRG